MKNHLINHSSVHLVLKNENESIHFLTVFADTNKAIQKRTSFFEIKFCEIAFIKKIKKVSKKSTEAQYSSH
jgi:hypothetical protein